MTVFMVKEGAKLGISCLTGTVAGERRLQIAFRCTCLLCADLGVSPFCWHYNVIHQEQEHLILVSNPKDYS